MKKVFLLLLFISCFQGSFAGVLDSISSSFHHKPKFFTSLTEYNNFLSAHPTNIIGLQAGLEFNHTVRIGIGYSWLSSQIVRPISISDASGSYSTNGQLKFRYWSTSFEYIFYNKYPWQFSVPIEFGAGGAHYEYLSRTDKARLTTDNFPVVLVEPALTAQYNITEWVGLVGGMGYPILLNSTHQLKRDFDSPIYYLKLKLFVDVIYKDLFPKGINSKDKK